MDRSRESRRSSMTTTTNGFPRRRNRTSGLRDSFEEGQLELQETVRLRAVASKKDRDRDRDRDRDKDRDSSSRNKRRRGSHRDEGEQSTEESVGNEEDYEVDDAGVSSMLSPNTASSASDQNYRRSFPPARPGRPPPPPWKVTDEVIGVTVPRKARSASVKRSHDSWVSANGAAEEQNFRQRSDSPGIQSVEAASPLSSNVSVRKKMKAIGPKTRLPRASKSSSSTQEDIEIEIAELLYGLKTSKNQESSQKFETGDTHGITGNARTSVPSPIRDRQTSVSRGTSPSFYPFPEVENKKVEDHNSSTLFLNSSAAGSLKNESEQPAKVETWSSESAMISAFIDGNSTGRKTGSSEAPIEDIKEGKLKPSAGCVPTGDLPSCCELNADKKDSAAKKAAFVVSEANSKHVEKFEIDLMAPPPMVSPERYDLSRGDFTSETKALELDVELKRGNNIKVEDKVERIVKKEKAAGEIQELKMDVFKKNGDLLKLDLERPSKDNESATSNELEEKDRNREQPPKLTNLKVEKIAQSSSVPSSTAVPGWPSSLPPFGYMSPSQTVVKTDKSTGSSTAPQHANFILSQPQPKRCTTHHYIARNIFLHQQFLKANPYWPAAIGSAPLCGKKSNNVAVNGMSSTESSVVGKQSQQKLPGLNQNAAQEKGWTAASFPSLAANKSSSAANSLDAPQRKQLVLQQGPASAVSLVPGPAYLFPLGQHQTSVAAATSQVGGANSTSSASSSSKSNSSAAVSLGTSSALPAVAAAMSFSYPNLAASEAPYVTIVQNNGYPFPFSTPLGGTAAIRGSSPAQATHILNGPFYSSQMFHPLQHPQQHPHSQALLQPSYLDTGTSKGSSSSHKQPHGAQVNGNNILTPTNLQLQQQSHKQHTSLSCPRKLETEMGGENVPSVTSRTSFSQKNVYGQNFTIPVQPVNFSFKPSATSDSVSGNGGNLGDKQQPQQAIKGGVELIPSQAFAISFAPFNGSTVPSNLNFSSMAQNPVIIHGLPDIAWQGYQAAGTAHTQKTYSMTEGKSGGNSTYQDDEKKARSGKSSTNGPTTLVFDNSSKNLNFMLSPTNGSWPSHSIATTSITTSAPLSSNASSSQEPQQLLQLQKQHGMPQQQPPMATRYKVSSTNTTSTKFVNNAPVFSQTPPQCNGSNQASQSKSSGRNQDSQVRHPSIIKSTAPTLKNFSQEQGRVLHGYTQISFGGNYNSSLPPQGQQLLGNSQCTTIAGSAPNGSNLKLSRGSKVGSSTNTLQMQQSENSSTGTGQKSSPVCGRNVPSILSSCPSHLSEPKY